MSWGAFRASSSITLIASAASLYAQTIDYERDVAPIFADACLSCHGESEPQGRFRIDSRVSVYEGGFAGPGVVPGKLEKSVVYQRLTSDDLDERAPFQSEPLAPEKVEIIRMWIEQGANWPDALTYRFQGRDFRLTDVAGRVVRQLLT